MKFIYCIITLCVSLGLQASMLDGVRPVVPVKEVESFKKISALYDVNKVEAYKLLKVLPKERSAVFDYLEGGIHMANEQVDKALAQFESAIKKFPDFYKAHVIVGSIYLNQKNYDKALKTYSKIVTLGRADGRTWKNLAYLHIQKKNYLAAEQAYQSARVFLPKDKSLDQNFLQLRLLQNDYQAALNLALELLDKDETNQSLWKTVIDCLNRLDRQKEALHHYEIYAKLFSLTDQERMQLAGLYYNQKLYQDAVDQYAKVEGSEKVSALRNQVLCLNELEQYTQVLDLLKGDLQQYAFGDREKLFVSRAQAAMNLNKFSDAKQDYLKALEYNSQNSQILFALAELYEQAEDRKEALRYYGLASKEQIYRSASLMRQARLYLMDKQYRLALKAAQDAKLSDNSDAVKRFYEQVKQVAEKYK
jgi:tetratricopeptide (TPR) repeat protein